MSILNPSLFHTVGGGQSSIHCNSSSCLLLPPTPPSPYFASLPPGSYFFEVWGASGGDRHFVDGYISLGGRGGYSSGFLSHYGSDLYFFIDTKGGNGTTNGIGGWNGGGTSHFWNTQYPAGGSGGGGGTDICTSGPSSWDESSIRSQESLQSRFIVAGGGGGAWSIGVNTVSEHRRTSAGGYGGGIIGGNSGHGHSIECNYRGCMLSLPNLIYSEGNDFVTGATQTSSGSNSSAISGGSLIGGFGFGGDSIKIRLNTGGGGGGGWFGGVGGSNGINDYGTGGSGGSGYVHSCSNNYSSLGCSFNMNNPQIKTGNEALPDPYEGFSDLAHPFDFSNGSARITLISSSNFHPSNIFSNNCIPLSYISFHVIIHLIFIS